MRMSAIALLAALGIAATTTAYASTSVRISQVYGGNGGTWNQDYVELYNNSGVPVAIGGWSLQYGSATNTTGFGTLTVFQIPAGKSIPACGYFLIGLATAATGAALPVAPDASTSVINASSVSGKIILINAPPGPIPCLGNVNPEPANWLDEVGYGTGAGLCFETAAAPGLSTTTTLVRAGGGATDTDNNSADYTNPLSSTISPRNSSSPINPLCTPSIGACCQPGTGLCSMVDPGACTANGGVYMGDGTSCATPGVCQPVPVDRKSWGKLKTIYR